MHSGADIRRSIYHIIRSTAMTGSEYNQTMHSPLRWRHNDHDSVSNHQPHGCLLNRLYRRRSKKTSKCGEFTGTGEFPAQRASYAENVSIWWRHHATYEVSIVRYLERIGRVITALHCIYLCASQHESTCKGLVFLLFAACSFQHP